MYTYVWSGFSGEVRLREPPCSTAGGKYRCSICRDSRFSASTRCVTCAATGCAPTLRDPSVTMAGARAAATCCGRCRRPWALDFECDLVPSRPARRCGPGPASGNVPKLTALHAEKLAAPFFVPAAFAAAGVVRYEAAGITRSAFSVSSASTRPWTDRNFLLNYPLYKALPRIISFQQIKSESKRRRNLL